jgi:Leucine-rich repeat (LRR) protein
VNLEKLLLEKLPLQVIPVNIVYLKNLKVLSLNGCYNMNVYNALRILSNMHQLQVLDISFTGTHRVPNEIVNLKNLKVLIWQEEGSYNQAEIERIQAMMPNTRIYSGNGPRPFLRSNSLNTILNGY